MRERTTNTKRNIETKKKHGRDRLKRSKSRRLKGVIFEAIIVVAVPLAIIMIAVNYKNSQSELSSMSYDIDENSEATDMTGWSDQDVFMPENDYEYPDVDINENTNDHVDQSSDVSAEDIIAQGYGYPEELIEMLEKYPETIEFVKEYSEKKDTIPAENVGYVEPGEIPLFIQWDDRWGYSEFGDYLIATDGCGPTCLSMVIVGLTGDIEVTPYKVSCFAEENDYYESGAGSKWILMSEGAQHFGVVGTELPLYKSSVFEALENGCPIICSVSEGDFTTNGHFIVLTGVENGKIKVNDPNSRIQSSKLWDYERIEGQINNLWSFTVSE